MKNAVKRRIAFELTPDEWATAVVACGNRCTLTGLPFDLSTRSVDRRKRPLAPSLDRIDSAIGYRVTNLRLVCVAVNLALNSWGESVLLDIARALLGQGEHAPWIGHPGRKCPPGVRLARLKSGIIRYVARPRYNGKHMYIGTFATAGEAYAVAQTRLQELSQEST